ncbi:hypothetical protein Zm00014a_034098 [Zea mays]|uniref:Uncharacterized protein n=1 Tax=Zea mays TaxID=4577 RepID=A0A3L6E354_MAIZE|nr:hypothetical protein Zm00014a_034098 [Zea mays]
MAPGAGDNSDPASYIHTVIKYPICGRRSWVMEQVQHLIERCMTFGMSMEEYMEALAKRADVQPVVTSTGYYSSSSRDELGISV